MPPYFKTSAMGGTLIRKVMAQFKAQKFALPIRDPIAIATSGGVDSMVLAHLVARYGRKVIDPTLITLLHFDHQWRKESSNVEKKAVAALAKKLGVSFESVILKGPKEKQSKNLENDAREKRRNFYDAHVGPTKRFRYVLTAHHLDDVAETVFWRFLRGEFNEQREAILFCDDQQLRPFLQVSKEEFYSYARQEKLKFYEDPTNASTEQMRGFLRHQVFPLLKTRFSAVSTVLARYAMKAHSSESVLPTVIEAMTCTKVNRPQRLELEKMLRDLKTGARLSLGKGIIVERQKSGFFIKIIENIDEND
jgi:tRNA(Ile)-lysidine synthase